MKLTQLDLIRKIMLNEQNKIIIQICCDFKTNALVVVMLTYTFTIFQLQKSHFQLLLFGLSHHSSNH